MSQLIETSTRTFTAGGALGKHILVKLSAGVLAAAGLAEQPIGAIETQAFASGEEHAVRLRSARGTIKCVAAGAFSAGALVYGRAAGKVDDVSTSSAVLIGMAMEAATAANDIVEVMPL